MKVLPKSLRLHRWRLSQRNQMPRPPRKPFHVFEILSHTKKEEIMEIIYKRDNFFLVLENSDDLNEGEHLRHCITKGKPQSATTINYRSLVEKLIQLEPNDCPKFQELLKTYIQPKSIKPKELTTNTQTIPTDNPKDSTKINTPRKESRRSEKEPTTKHLYHCQENLYKTQIQNLNKYLKVNISQISIRPPILKIDNSGKKTTSHIKNLTPNWTMKNQNTFWKP